MTILGRRVRRRRFEGMEGGAESESEEEEEDEEEEKKEEMAR